jgi:hypothetical protein
VLKEDIAAFKVAVDTYPAVPRPTSVEFRGPSKVYPLILDTYNAWVLVIDPLAILEFT